MKNKNKTENEGETIHDNGDKQETKFRFKAIVCAKNNNNTKYTQLKTINRRCLSRVLQKKNPVVSPTFPIFSRRMRCQ